MARLGCPKERSLHAKGLTPLDLGLQFPWHPPERRSSPTRFIRRHASCLPQILLLRRINAIRFRPPEHSGGPTVENIFISYSRNDRDFVHRLVHDLETAGISVFFDQRVKPGASWVDSISNAIEHAKFLLIVLSPDYVDSVWAQEEMKVGLLRESEGKAMVIPLMVRKCQPPAFIAAKAYANFADSYEVGLQQLIPVLKETVQDSVTKPVPGNPTEQTDPKQLAQFHAELRQAVARFKAPPKQTKDLENLSIPQNATRKCFVVMPFGNEDLQIVYEDVVRPVIDKCGLSCERGDDVFGSNVIMDDIRVSIDTAAILVADLTGRNANVFYEVGIAHAIGKPVLLMAQSIEDVPFDLRHRRVLLYEYSLRGGKRLEKTLQDNLTAMLKSLA